MMLCNARGVLAAALVGFGVSASSVLAGDSLLINGDAESGEMAPWAPNDLIEIAESTSAGIDGLPDGEDIGEFCFTGLFGPELQSCSQTIDLSKHADQIDAGCFQLEFRGLLQSRTAGQTLDRVTCTFTFLDGDDQSLGAALYVDTSIVDGVFDWSLFEEIHTAPAGTRRLLVTFDMTRQGGSSTDCFVDNVTVTIVGPSCPADLDASGVVDVDDLLALLGAWGPYDGPCDLDIIPDGVVDVNDLLALLAAWGPC